MGFKRGNGGKKTTLWRGVTDLITKGLSAAKHHREEKESRWNLACQWTNVRKKLKISHSLRSAYLIEKQHARLGWLHLTGAAVTDAI